MARGPHIQIMNIFSRSLLRRFNCCQIWVLPEPRHLGEPKRGVDKELENQ
jgi:hypothetical protein